MQASNFPRLFALVTASETYEVTLFQIKKKLTQDSLTDITSNI